MQKGSMTRKTVKYYNALIKITVYPEADNPDSIPTNVEDAIDNMFGEENVWGNGTVWLELKKFTQKRKKRVKK
jgi:hypothetical protein